MEHFEDGDWADYVRGLVSAPEREKMTAHLAAGCDRCQDIADALGSVVTSAAADAAFAPPSHLVRSAIAMFSLQHPERIRLRPSLIATLMYDSFRDPAPVGVRSGQPLSRQVLYSAGPYTVDVRLDNEQGAKLVSLTGQIASRDPNTTTGHLMASLTSAGRSIANAVTNEAGEFQIDYEPHPHLCLQIDIDSNRQIQLPLTPKDRPEES